MDDFLSTINIQKRKKKICPMCIPSKEEKEGGKTHTEFNAQPGEIWCKKCRAKAEKLDHRSYKINYNGDGNG